MRNEPLISSNDHTANTIDTLTNDELIDLFLYYVDDVYDEKINELTLQIRLYGLVACAVTTLFILIGLLFVTVWLFALTNKVDSEDDEDFENNQSITNNILEQNFSAVDDDKLSVDTYKDKIYVSQWDLPIKVKQKAIFWKAPVSTDPDYKDYESVLTLYEKDTEPSHSNRNSQLDLKDNEYETDNNSCLDLASVSRTDSIQQTVTAFYGKSQTNYTGSSCISSRSQTKVQNISLIDEEDSSSYNSYDAEDDVSYDSMNDPVSETEMSVYPSQNFKKLPKSSLPKGYNAIGRELHHTLSYIETVKLSKIGPSYLKQYLNVIYGNDDDFEYCSLLSCPHNDSTITTNDENVHNALEFLNHKIYISDEETIEKLKFLRYSYLLPAYQQEILTCIIANLKFLCYILNEKENKDHVKREIFQLFYCTIWCESTVHLPSNFVANIIEEMMISLSYMDIDASLFKECFRCLEGTIIYFNFDDFESKLFDRIFINVNNYTFERQNIIWECLKLFICQWMLAKVTEPRDIYKKLKRKVEVIISGYVEKDNLKYHEFLLIWRMLNHTRNLKLEDQHIIANDNCETNENENQNLEKSSAKVMTKINANRYLIARNKLQDITNFN